MEAWVVVAGAAAIPLAALIIAVASFLRTGKRDGDAEFRKDCTACFEERRRLQRDNIELMRLLFEQPHKTGGVD